MVIEKVQNAQEQIRQVYLRYPYPWVIGFSGGKDSTATLQIIWYALQDLPDEALTKPIYVISTNTLVETPVVVDILDKTLDLLEAQSTQSRLPIEVHRLHPNLDGTFWVNLIGRGYPAPNSLFRWCTERLKIQPSNRFILDRVAEHGEVILALGMRKGESIRRDQVVKEHHYNWHALSRHGQLPGAWVYMPIEDFSTEDVWGYLLNTPSPWGGDNRRLRALYKSAQDGECPVVVDNSTESCGNSRFGCWVCTVVERDRAMEALIEEGEEWLVPLLDFRDWLASTQNPEVKPQQREFKGRNGRIRITNRGLLWRSYTLEFSKEMLHRLLEAQRQIQQHIPDFIIITLEELREIRRLWITERQDWVDSLPQIYSQVTGHNHTWEINDVSTPGKLELDLLQQFAQEYTLPISLPQKLMDAEWQYHGMRRRGLIHKTIEGIFNEDWLTLEEAQARARSTTEQDVVVRETS